MMIGQKSIVSPGKKVSLDEKGEYIVESMQGNYYTIRNIETRELIDGNIERSTLRVI